MKLRLGEERSEPGKVETPRIDETLVWSMVYPPPNVVLRESASTTMSEDLMKVIRGGLPWIELEALQEILDVPLDKLAPMLRISKATLHRRKNEGRLTPEESDRVIRFARLMHIAIEALETEENARAWLSMPQQGLGGALPLEYAEAEMGAREVESLLTRIQYGVYS